MSTSNVVKAVPADDGIRLSTTVTVLLLAGGLVVACLADGRSSRTCGARRSVQLQFEDRQAAIEQVVATEERQDPSSNQ
jgi:hypothetical protein